jgi:sarcosine oxidase subunit alpha
MTVRNSRPTMNWSLSDDLTMQIEQPFRLQCGGLIDRTRPLEFECNGVSCIGYAGDTLASALLANGVRVVGRSFKFHRPRGVMSAGIEETNALFQIEVAGQVHPLVRATQQPLLPGLRATTENAWPSVRFDIGRMFDLTHRLWPAGFYNKTFKWPSWHWYEGAIRNLAGSGRVPAGPDISQYFQHTLHCDVLVVGAGPAGLNAALSAAEQGARVVLADLEPRLGGSLRYETRQVAGMPAFEWVRTVVARLQELPNVRLLTSTTVAGAFDHQTLLAVDRSACGQQESIERLWKLRAQRVVLATGAIEQPLVFDHNDRPGVFLASAVRRYLREFAVTVGRSVVVATNNDDAYQTAFALHDAGVSVPAIADSRETAAPDVLVEASRRGLRVLPSSVVQSVKGARGVQSARVARLGSDGKAVAGARTIACDAVAMSGGWSPTVHLYSQARGKLRYDAALLGFVPDGTLRGWFAAGSANGADNLENSLRQGLDAGRTAVQSLRGEPSAPTPATHSACAVSSRPSWRTPGGNSSRQWIDFRHDVTASDIELAVRENYSSVEHAKRYTTAGMSIDQGKTSNLNALTYLAELTNRSIEQTGTTTFRPMYSPVSMGAIAAGQQREFYSPTRRLSAEAWHRAAGATFDEYSGWQRPAYYARPGESRDAAIAREVRAVRTAVGMFDGSPIGKIEVKGPDAAEFLNRIYLNNVLSLANGRVRYGVMLNENGIVMDDGVFARMAPDHFLVCPTSSGADRIAAWLDEWHQCEWPSLNVVIAPVTTQWAVCTVAGPHARDLLQSLDCDIDLSRQSLPHLGYASGRLLDGPVRVQRVSFTGEASFEVSVPARTAERVFESVMRAGVAFGITPFGVEALLLMRTEKGYLHVGVDSDGTTNPYDLGFGSIIDKKQGDFVGCRSLQRAHDQSLRRRQLVGLEPVKTTDSLIAGAHIVERSGGRRRSAGFVTSACKSPTLERSIALALLEGGFARYGEIVSVSDSGREISARVVRPSFYDAGGERLHA